VFTLSDHWPEEKVLNSDCTRIGASGCQSMHGEDDREKTVAGIGFPLRSKAGRGELVAGGVPTKHVRMTRSFSQHA
jgi:hypothetical protein